MSLNDKSVILFDGVCNFCNYWVNFILDRDKESKFKFAPLQSEKGIELLKKYNLPTNDFDSFILISKDKIYKKSLAAFEIARQLKGWPKILLVFKFLPVSFTDWVYALIANNRYRFFGKKEACRIPTPEERTRFL